MSLLRYKYYDTPEGTDVWKKTFVTSKYAAATGFIMGFHDANMYSHSKGFFNSALRYGFYMGPLVSMAATFTVTTNLMQQTRGKNDVWNYFWGGFACGPIVSIWTKNPYFGTYMGLFLGIAGAVKKMGVDQDWTFFPIPVQMAHSAWDAKNDFTLTRELGPKGYTTNPE